MKNIFRFLGIVALILVFGRGVSQNVINPKSNLRVRYAVELKEIPKAEAESYLTSNGGPGYVDLWTYIYFSPEWVSQGFIKLNGSVIEDFALDLGQNSHSYKMIDAYGNDYPVGDIATFAPRSGVDACGSITQPRTTGRVTMVWKLLCPTWAYGGMTSPAAASAPGTLVEAIPFNGETWYRMKQYQIRFIYKKAESFYVTYFSNKDGLDGGKADGGLNLNIASGKENDAKQGWPIVWNNWEKCTRVENGKTLYGNNDWSYAKYNWQSGDPLNPCGKDVDAFDLIPGGLKIIADPDMQLTAEAACGGSDVTGKLNVNDWAGKDWSNYGSVKFYVNATGGSVSSRKLLNSGSDITTTPSVPASGSTAPIAYTLTPAGYTLTTGNPADSLIWVIEDTFLA